jgi:cellulose synthase (UDP-forming)
VDSEISPLVPGGAVHYRGRDVAIRVVALLAILAGAVYLTWRGLYTWNGSQPEMFIVLYVCEVFGWAMLTSFAFLAWRVPSPSRPSLESRPTVDIFVCTYDEDVSVLAATLVGCDRVSYPHVTWLLDDGRREEAKKLADRFGARYITRADNRHAKAGNINSALTQTDGQLLLILDADHVPQPDILDAVVGYFDDPTVALVQTPHDFGNRDSFQHFSAGRHDQSIFFEVMMPGKDRHNGAFWCGSAAVLRRSALEGVGGIATETIAEDFHTTIRLHGQGWRTRYNDETLVQGLAPHDLASFLLQRDRWARGNLAVLRTRENPFIARGLTIKQRASYLSSLLAYFVPIQRLAMLGVLVAMLAWGQLPVHAPLWELAALWAPWMVLDLSASTMLARGQANLFNDAYAHSLTAEIFARAAVSIIHPTRTTFKVTPKDGIDDGGWTALKQLRLILTVTVVVFVASVARLLTIAGLVHLPALSGVAETTALVFASWELTLMTSALWRVTRRHQIRHHFRVPVEIAGVFDGGLIRVVDLTPAGAGVIASEPLAVGSAVPIEVNLSTVSGAIEKVHLDFSVRSCRRADESGWRMGGTLSPVTEWDGEMLIEHCHLVTSRERLIEWGRLLPAGADITVTTESAPLASEA